MSGPAARCTGLPPEALAGALVLLAAAGGIQHGASGCCLVMRARRWAIGGGIAAAVLGPWHSTTTRSNGWAQQAQQAHPWVRYGAVQRGTGLPLECPIIPDSDRAQHVEVWTLTAHPQHEAANAMRVKHSCVPAGSERACAHMEPTRRTTRSYTWIPDTKELCYLLSVQQAMPLPVGSGAASCCCPLPLT